MTTLTTGDNRGVIAGRDIIDSTLITTGDVAGSYNAIGVGARVIVQQVQAVSPTDERRKAMHYRQALLAGAIEAKVTDYTRRLDETQDDVRRNPYKNLPAYQLVDAPYFYGRETAIGELLDHMHQSSLTVLHAASGAGKSSLLQAGLMSRLLANGRLPLYIRTRAYKGSAGQAGLSTLIKAAFLPTIGSDPDLASLNEMSLLGFFTEVSRNLGESSLYVFLDQFEDFFNDALMHPMLRQPFVDDLQSCLDEPGLNVRWVLSLRKEYLSDLHIFGDAVFHNQVYLPGLTDREARQVIVEPAGQMGVGYEEGLVTNILADLTPQIEETPLTDGPVTGGEAGQPPALQIDAPPTQHFAPTQIQLVCHTLFEEMPQGAETITFTLYRQRRGRRNLPGVEGILTGHLQNVLNTKLPKVDRPLASLMLAELVSSQMRRVPLSQTELIAQLRQRRHDVDPLQVQRILVTLVNNRLLEADDDAAERDTTYELTHDYLLQEIELNQATLRRKAAQELLNQEVAAWRTDKRSRIGEEKLRIIEEQDAELLVDDDAAELLRLSRDAVGRRKRTVFVSYGAAGVAGAMATLTLIAALFLSRQAREAIGRADSANASATANAVAQVTAQAKAQATLTAVEGERRKAEAAVIAAEVQVEQLAAEGRLLDLANLARSESQAGRYDTALLLSQEIILRTLTTEHRYDAALDAGVREALESAPAYRATLAGHSAEVLSAVFNGDGSQVVTASEDGTAIIWDAESGREVHMLTGHGDSVSSAVFNNDGGLVVTASEDGTAKIWDVESGSEVHTLIGHGNSVHSAIFNNDGSQIVTASEDGTARIWDVASGDEIHALTGRDNSIFSAVFSAEFSPDGSLVVTASRDGTATIWDVASGDEVHTLTGHDAVVLSAVFNADGRQVVTTSSSGTAKIWDVASGDEVHTLTGHDNWVNSAMFNNDGTQLVTASRDTMAKIWDVASGEVVHTLIGHEDWVYSAVFNSDSTQVITASRDGSAKIWDVASGEAVHSLTGNVDSVFSAVFSAVFSPDGGRAVTASFDGMAKIWDVAGGDEFHTLTDHSAGVLLAVFNGDDSQVMTASRDGTARIWDVASGEIVHTLTGHDGVVLLALLNGGDGRIMTESDDGTVKIWDVMSGKVIQTLTGHTYPIWSADFDDDGSTVVMVGSGGTAKIWDVASGEVVHTLTGHDHSGLSIAFNGDGSKVVTASHDGTAKIWDVASGELVHTLTGHANSVHSAVFNGDGSQVVTASFGPMAKIWDVASGGLVHTLTGHEDWINSAVFNGDGSKVVTASGDGTAKIWDVASGETAHTLRGHGDEVSFAVFNGDGGKVVTASRDGTAKIWDVASGETIHTLTGHRDLVSSAAFNSDGSMVVTISRDGTAKIWAVDANLLLEQIHRRIQRDPPEFTEVEKERFGISDPIPYPQTGS